MVAKSRKIVLIVFFFDVVVDFYFVEFLFLLSSSFLLDSSSIIRYSLGVSHGILLQMASLRMFIVWLSVIFLYGLAYPFRLRLKPILSNL